MATLLSTQTTNTTGSGASHTGPCSVLVKGTMDGASVSLEPADSDSEANYHPIGIAATFTSTGWVSVHLQGTYFLRAKLNRAGASTSVTVVTTQ